MQFELKRIQREVGITFVYVTHDQEEALTMSDRIAVMNEGNVEQIGTPTEIYDRPATVFVAGFIGQANLWPAGRRASDGDFAEVSVLGTTLRARPGDTDHRAGGHATLMVRPERVRVSVDAADRRRRTVPATVTDLTFQGPVVRLSLARPTTRRSSPTSAPSRSCRCCDPAIEVYVVLGARGVAGAPAADIPTTEDLEEMLDDLSTSRLPHRPPFPSSTKGTPPWPPHHIDRIDPASARRPPDEPPPVPRRRCRCRGGVRARPVLPGRMRLEHHDEFQRSTSAAARRRQPASGNLRISNWPLYMADGFVAGFQTASGITVDYKEDFNDNEEWFAKDKEPLSRKQDIGADLVVPTEFMAVRAQGPGLAQRDQRRPGAQQAEPAPRSARTSASDPAASSPRRTCPA